MTLPSAVCEEPDASRRESSELPIVADALIVGSGMTAQAAGHRLVREGFRVVLLDKARGVGGRMSTRSFAGATFDHGAQFFTVRSGEFGDRVHRWEEMGLVEAWFQKPVPTPAISTAPGQPKQSDPGASWEASPLAAAAHSAGHFRYRGKPSMTAMAKDFDRRLAQVVREAKVTRLSHVDGLWRAQAEDGRSWLARTLLLTPPMPQTVALLAEQHDLIPKPLLDSWKAVRYTKSITVMVRLDRPTGLPAPGYLSLPEPEPLMTIVDNQLKGISTEPSVTLQSGPAFAERFYDAPDAERVPLLWAAAAPFLGDARPLESQVHRWGLATCENPLSDRFGTVPSIRLWVAGDAFGGSRIECAFQSGYHAGLDLCAHLATLPPLLPSELT